MEIMCSNWLIREINQREEGDNEYN